MIPSNSRGSGWTGSPGEILSVAAEDGKALEPVCRYFLEDSGHVQPYACSEGPGYACCKAGLGETVITDTLGTVQRPPRTRHSEQSQSLKDVLSSLQAMQNTWMRGPMKVEEEKK